MQRLVWHHGALSLGRAMMVLGLFLLLLGGAHAVFFRRAIFPFVYIAGVEVSNKNAEDAAELINSYIESEDEGAWLSIEGQKIKLPSEEIGLKYETQKAVAEAWLVGRRGGLAWKAWERMINLFYKRQIDLAFTYDEENLEGWLIETVSEMEAEPIKPSLRLVKGEIVFENGKNGKKADKEKLIREVKQSLGQIRRTDIKVDMKMEKQELDQLQAEAVLRLAGNLAGKSLTIKGEVDGEELFKKTLSDVDLIGLVGFFDKWNRQKITGLAEEAKEAMNRSPSNARFEKVGEKIVDFAAEKMGIEVEIDEFVENLVAALEAGAKEMTVPYRYLQPEIKAGEINDLGIEELLGRGESNYKHSIANRAYNVALASSRINGVLVAPDEVFSFNKAVGSISAASGYKSAWIISQGRTILGDGGGVCQVSTTLFRAILKAGLPIVERKAHSYRVGYYEQGFPMGLDATVFSPRVDLKFKNDTGKWLLIQTKADSKNMRLTVDIYGTNDGRVANVSETKIFSSSRAPAPKYIDDPSLPAGRLKQIDFAAGGARVAFDYVVTRGDKTLINKTFYSNYQPWRAVFLRGTGTN